MYRKESVPSDKNIFGGHTYRRMCAPFIVCHVKTHNFVKRRVNTKQNISRTVLLGLGLLWFALAFPSGVASDFSIFFFALYESLCFSRTKLLSVQKVRVCDGPFIVRSESFRQSSKNVRLFPKGSNLRMRVLLLPRFFSCCWERDSSWDFHDCFLSRRLLLWMTTRDAVNGVETTPSLQRSVCHCRARHALMNWAKKKHSMFFPLQTQHVRVSILLKSSR